MDIGRDNGLVMDVGLREAGPGPDVSKGTVESSSSKDDGARPTWKAGIIPPRGEFARKRRYGMGATTQDLSDVDLQRLMDLIRDADSVELKLTLHESARASTGAALGVDALDAQIRQVFFFDTPDLALNAAGVVVRARRRQGEEGDTVVKLRPVVPNEVAEHLRKSKTFNVEVDAMPGGFVCSASFKGVADNGEIREAAQGGRSIAKLFSKEQRKFYEEHAPEGLKLDSLSILGPIPIIKLKVQPAGFARKMVGELWMYPDGSQIVELSTKAKPAEAFQVIAEAKAFLLSKGVDLTGEQQTKTKTALEFFSEAPQKA